MASQGYVVLLVSRNTSSRERCVHMSAWQIHRMRSTTRSGAHEAGRQDDDAESPSQCSKFTCRTYQEMLLSSRKLVFTSTQMYF